ncbi:hypothetical protein [Actinotalea sp. JY-7876]|uniref:hypothetical protein n=1 Tax=Actinotalea sp. JY-7876 TaxID=2758442 RepID=UPI0015F493BD|nr:hypothetical protein [Actinotalea sp. JY-7876]
MESLGPGAQGTYLVRTLTAAYVVDLDAATLERHPAVSAPLQFPAPADLRRDHEPVTLAAVLDCRIGASMTVLIVLGDPATAPLTVRQTTAVQAIERVG